MSRTTTPPTGSAAESLQSVHSTPQSAGTGSHVAYSEQHVQELYHPYLEVDIAHSATIPFEDFLSLIFPKHQGHIYPSIDEDKKFTGLLNAYGTEYAHHETSRYHPFNEVVNFIVKKMSSNKQDSIVICRNDPIYIVGSASVRKPDCVIVRERAMLSCERDSADNLSKNGPEKGPFHWSELLAFVEFKLEHPIAFSAPPPGVTNTSAQAPPAISNSSSHSAIPGPSSNPLLDSISSPQASTTSKRRKKASSSKRSGDNLMAPSSKRKKSQTKEHAEPLSREKVLVQCASYALEMLSHGGLYTHVLGALVTDNRLELLYYDRSLHLRSEAVNFLIEPSRLVKLVHCMDHATSKQWGRVDNIAPGDGASKASTEAKPFDGAILTLNNGIVLRLSEVIFAQHALIGRGTCVVRATVIKGNTNWGTASVIVKFSFTPDTRTSEAEILQHIMEYVKKPGDEWVLDHLPKLLHCEIMDDATEVQKRIAEYFATRTETGGKKVEYESRKLHALVMEELLPIQKDLTTAHALITVIKDVFKCYKWLYEIAGVLHRDISENNLMCKKKTNDILCGVICDFDLSILLKREHLGPSSKQRTGTRPFMALDLLEGTPIQHFYRHDLESLFYIIVVFMYRSQEKTSQTFKDYPAIKEWFLLGPKELLRDKRAFYLHPLPDTTVSDFRKVRLSVADMRNMFKDGFNAQIESIERSPLSVCFNASTLNGNVDFEKFQKILDSIKV